MLTARASQITGRLHELERNVLRTSVNRVFTIAHSNYENIDLEALSKGYQDVYEPHEMDAFEAKVTPLS